MILRMRCPCRRKPSEGPEGMVQTFSLGMCPGENILCGLAGVDMGVRPYWPCWLEWRFVVGSPSMRGLGLSESVPPLDIPWCCQSPSVGAVAWCPCGPLSLFQVCSALCLWRVWLLPYLGLVHSNAVSSHSWAWPLFCSPRSPRLLVLPVGDSVGVVGILVVEDPPEMGHSCIPLWLVLFPSQMWWRVWS